MNIASFSEHCNGLFDAAIRAYPVSYIHLTLPTSYSV